MTQQAGASAEAAVATEGAGHRPVRVCLASRRYHPVYSGAALRFKRYAPGLQARGIELSVFTATPEPAKAAVAGMSDDWRDLPNGSFLPVEEVEGVPVHRIRVPDRGTARRIVWFNRGILTHCRKAPRPPDVVQLFTPALTGLPWLMGLRRMGIPIVATRSMMPELPRGPFKRWFRRTSMRVASRASHREVVGSEAMLGAFQAIGIHADIEVIPHGVDLERFRPPSGPGEVSAVRHSLGLPEDALVLLFVGAFIPRKGAHHLLKAWSLVASTHPELHLIMVGPRLDRGSPELTAYHRELEALMERSGARDRIHLPGVVAHVEEYMRASNLFVFPSEREGMPNVLGEAMASGLPIVSCPFSGLSREFGEAGIHYVLSDFDAHRLAVDIAGLLAIPRRREQFGRQARAWAAASMDVDRSIDRYASLYRTLAGERERARARLQ
jgi:glycosyltransferase involved in cell wall biosynthesis